MLRTELIRPVGELLGQHAEQRGPVPAFRDARRAVDWAQLAQRTGRLAGALRARVDRGATVAICLENSVEAAESYLAVARAGNLGAFLNPRASDEELAYMLRDSGAVLLICDDRDRAALARRAPALERVVVVGSPGPDAEAYEDLVRATGTAPDDLALDAPAWMLYTSGTTGRPKGVLLTQRSCLWVVAACWSTAAGIGADDYVLSPLPLFHSYALVLSVLAVVATGASVRLLPRFSTQEVLHHLRAESVTVLAGVPTMFHYLLSALDDQPLAARALKVSVSAGAVMPGDVTERFEHVSGVPLLDGYGITETSTMVTINWPTGTRPPGSCGLPVPGCAVRIVEPATGADVAPGAEGELLVRGPQLMLGYHGQPAATAEALRDGWYHSGDLARSDSAGYLTITGRAKELIIRGGENVYPAEVEAVITQHPDIADAAVVGRAHEALGETVIAFVVVRREPDYELLREFLAARLTDFKIPSDFFEIDAIPRTGSGKIRRHELQATIAR